MAGTIRCMEFLNSEEAKAISNFILENESRVKATGPDKYGGTNEDSLTGRYAWFNYLNEEPGKILIPKLRKLFGTCVVQCWANTFRKGEGIKPHSHQSPKKKQHLSCLCANIFLSGPNPGTVYPKYGTLIPNIGSLVLFPNDCVHYVEPNETDEVRVSMAMDIYLSPEDKILAENHPHRFVLISPQ